MRNLHNSKPQGVPDGVSWGLPLCKFVGVLPILLLLFLGACEPSGTSCDPLRIQRDDALEQARKADLRVKRLAEENRRLREQVRNLRGGGVDPTKYAFVTEALDIGRYSGGLNTNDVPGHDAVVVYVEPKDRQGSTIKAAGDLRVRLFDLAEAEGKTLLADKHITATECEKHFHAGRLGYHYRVELPLTAPPAHPELTVQVEFLDALTGRTFRAQKAITVELPPAAAETNP